MRLILFVLVTLITTLAGCAGNSERPEIRERLLSMGLEMGESGVDIPRYRVNSWTSIDDANLIITAGVNDRYLVQLTTPCQGLRGAIYIGFSTPTFGLDRFASIIVRGLDRRPERCSIQDIIRLYPIDG